MKDRADPLSLLLYSDWNSFDPTHELMRVLTRTARESRVEYGCVAGKHEREGRKLR